MNPVVKGPLYEDVRRVQALTTWEVDSDLGCKPDSLVDWHDWHRMTTPFKPRLFRGESCHL